MVNSMSTMADLDSVGTWIRRPGHVYACVGKNAYFDWMPGDPGTSINPLYFLANGSNMAGVYTGEKIQFSDDTSFTLKNVTEGDSGIYRLHLAGSTWRDEAQLTVLMETDLVPRTYVDDKLIDLARAEDILVNSESITNITVSRPSCGACQHLLLDFNILVNGKTKQCTNSSDCTYQLDWADLDTNQVQLTVFIQLNSCDVTSGPVIIQHSGDVASQSTNVGLIIALVCIGSVVPLAFFLLWLVLKIREKKNRSLQSWQKKYVHCLCCSKQKPEKTKSLGLTSIPEEGRAPSDVEQGLLPDNQTKIVNQNNSSISSRQHVNEEEEFFNLISDLFGKPDDNNDTDENSSSMHNSTEDLGGGPATTASTAQSQQTNTNFIDMVLDSFIPKLMIDERNPPYKNLLELAAPANNSGQDIAATDESTDESSQQPKDEE